MLIKNLKLFLLLFFYMSNSHAVNLCSDFFNTPTSYLFGLEFTFTNQKIINEGNINPSDGRLNSNPIKKEAWSLWIAEVQSKCAKTPKCQSVMSSDKHDRALKVIFEDGFYFTIGSDAAALEVNAQPRTRVEFNEVSSRLDEFVFETAKKFNLYPHERAGQGHIHVSGSAFSDGNHLRNFFVDFQNRPELIYGGLGNHLYNSPPLSAQKQSQRDTLLNLLSQLDRSVLPYSIYSFAGDINRLVYTSSVSDSWGSPDYYQSFNLTRLNRFTTQSTVEIRSFRPQKNTTVYKLQNILLERWIEKIRLRSEPIPYLAKSKYEYTQQEIVNSFAQLLHELDLSFESFKVLLPDQMQNIKPNNQYQSVNYNL